MTKIKLLVGDSALTEVNKLKNINFTFKIFQMQIFTFATLDQLAELDIFKKMSKQKERFRFSFGFKTKHPEKTPKKISGK